MHNGLLFAPKVRPVWAEIHSGRMAGRTFWRNDIWAGGHSNKILYERKNNLRAEHSLEISLNYLSIHPKTGQSTSDLLPIQVSLKNDE